MACYNALAVNLAEQLWWRRILRDTKDCNPADINGGEFSEHCTVFVGKDTIILVVGRASVFCLF